MRAGTHTGDSTVALHGSMDKRRPRAWLAAALASAGVVLAACGGGGGGGEGVPLQLRTVSNRADLVSGGDALVEVVAPSGSVLRDLKITLNGNDVSSAFSRTSDGRTLGLVTGLDT